MVRQFMLEGFKSRLSIGLIAWLAIWVLTLPLFHIHPVTHLKIGLAHTVFSPSLPGEFDVLPSLSFTFRNGGPCGPIAAFAQHQYSYPELGIASANPGLSRENMPGAFSGAL